MLREADALLDVLARHDVPLALSGHLHHPAAGESAGVREVMTPTTSEFPNAYLLLEVTPHGTAVEFVPLCDQAETERAYADRVAGNDNMRVGAGFAAARLATMPLVEEG